MLISRRSICAGLGTILLTGGGAVAQGVIPSPPAADKLEPGDFLWSKPYCSFVPVYKTGLVRMDPKDTWDYLKNDFLNRRTPKTSSMGEKQIDILNGMSFDNFIDQFHGTETQQAVQKFVEQSKDAKIMKEITAYEIAKFFHLYCGHAAIVGKPDSGGAPQVIEAEYNKTVVTIPYSDFCKNHDDGPIWHGRLKERTKEERVKVVEAAHDYTDHKTPYEFYNFNLRDERNVYCSKLPWLCVYKAFGIALDDKPLDGVRWFWFTPKMMLASQYIALVPGSLTQQQFAVPGPKCNSLGGITE
jgi:uncharacterized protein YycO